MFERFDERARRALFFARYAATRVRKPSIEPADLVEGVIREIDNTRVTVPPVDEVAASAAVRLGEDAKNILAMAVELANDADHPWITVYHLLLALLANDATRDAVEAKGFTRDRLLELAAGETARAHEAIARRTTYLPLSEEHSALLDDLAGRMQLNHTSIEQNRQALAHIVLDALVASNVRRRDFASLRAFIDQVNAAFAAQWPNP